MKKNSSPVPRKNSKLQEIGRKHEKSESNMILRNGSTGIASLPPEEKKKVANIVQKLVSLGAEHERTLTVLSEERLIRKQLEDEIKESTEQHFNVIEGMMRGKDDELIELKGRCNVLSGVLALYQGKLKNIAEMFRYYELNESESKIKITQLEHDVNILEDLTANQKLTIESIEMSSQRNNTALVECQHTKYELTSTVTELHKIIGEKNDHIIDLERKVQQLTLQLSTSQQACRNLSDRCSDLQSEMSFKASASIPTHSAPSQRMIIPASLEESYGPMFASLDSSSQFVQNVENISFGLAGSVEDNLLSGTDENSTYCIAATSEQRVDIVEEHSIDHPLLADEEAPDESYYKKERSSLDPTPMKKKKSAIYTVKVLTRVSNLTNPQTVSASEVRDRNANATHQGGAPMKVTEPNSTVIIPNQRISTRRVAPNKLNIGHVSSAGTVTSSPTAPHLAQVHLTETKPKKTPKRFKTPTRCVSPDSPMRDSFRHRTFQAEMPTKPIGENRVKTRHSTASYEGVTQPPLKSSIRYNQAITSTKKLEVHTQKDYALLNNRKNSSHDKKPRAFEKMAKASNNNICEEKEEAVIYDESLFGLIDSIEMKTM